jgi:hypothetical protein
MRAFPDERLTLQPKMPMFNASVHLERGDIPERLLMWDKDNRTGTRSKRREEALLHSAQWR